MNTADWKPFRLDELFEIRKGSYVPGGGDTEGNTPRVSSTSSDNGVLGTCGLKPNGAAGEITLARNGSVGEAFYQPAPFFATDDVHVLSPKSEPLTAGAALFVCTVLRLEKFRYGYGRKWSLEQMRNTVIKLPATESGAPDWELMEKTITALPSHDLIDAAYLTVPADPDPVTLPDIEKWGTFRLDELFEVKRGGAKGDTEAPLVGASARNNGVTGNGTGTVYPAGMVTVSWNGSIGEAFYQPEPFTASGDVRVLEPKTPLTPDAALFVCTVIRTERFRYSYGRKWGLEQMKRTELRLPVTDDGAPDWELMARYIRSLPYSGVFAAAV